MRRTSFFCSFVMSLFAEGRAVGPYVISIPDSEIWNVIGTYTGDATWARHKDTRVTYVHFPDEAENRSEWNNGHGQCCTDGV